MSGQESISGREELSVFFLKKITQFFKLGREFNVMHYNLEFRFKFYCNYEGKFLRCCNWNWLRK